MVCEVEVLGAPLCDHSGILYSGSRRLCNFFMVLSHKVELLLVGREIRQARVFLFESMLIVIFDLRDGSGYLQVLVSYLQILHCKDNMKMLE